MLVFFQLSVLGSYLPPVFTNGEPVVFPLQTIIRLSKSSHTAVCQYRPAGAFLVVVAVQLSLLGSYLPPVFTPQQPTAPPHTIISVPVQTAV